MSERLTQDEKIPNNYVGDADCIRLGRGACIVCFAEVTLLAEWLVGGNAIVGKTLATETTGSFLLEDTGVPSAFLCGDILDGTIGPNGTDEITKMLN